MSRTIIIHQCGQCGQHPARTPTLTLEDTFMAFMQPTAEYGTWLIIDGDNGTEIVPADCCGIPSSADLRPHGWRGSKRAGFEPASGSYANIPPSLRDYCDSRRAWSIVIRTGWCARLSAPGYMDCTPWDGPYRTERAALDAVKDDYECDDDGESLD